MTITPMERPAEFANKPFLTEQEVAEYENISSSTKRKASQTT